MTRLLPLFALLLSTSALADDPASFRLKSESTYHGSLIKRNAAISQTVPINKRYDELTAEQKQVLNAPYESMGEGDEPPFPRDGLAPLLKVVAAAQKSYLVTGTATFFVEVDQQGVPQSVSMQGDQEPKLLKAIGTAMMLIPYKPASCRGTPCRMTYPLRLSFKVD